MAMTITLSRGGPNPSNNGVVANRAASFVANIANTSSSSVTLTAFWVGVKEGIGARVVQPAWMTPNAPPGQGNPTVLGSSSVNIPFQVMFFAPNTPGPSPNNPSLGTASPYNAANVADPFWVVTVQAQFSDASTGSSDFFVPVLSTIAPFPIPEGGAFVFSQGNNFINGLMFGVL